MMLWKLAAWRIHPKNRRLRMESIRDRPLLRLDHLSERYSASHEAFEAVQACLRKLAQTAAMTSNGHELLPAGIVPPALMNDDCSVTTCQGASQIFGSYPCALKRNP